MSDNLKTLRKIKREGQYQEIDGMVVDGVTANAILLVYDNLKGKTKKKFKEIINKDISKASRIAWKLIK